MKKSRFSAKEIQQVSPGQHAGKKTVYTGCIFGAVAGFIWGVVKFGGILETGVFHGAVVGFVLSRTIIGLIAGRVIAGIVNICRQPAVKKGG
ncbi:MAG TPA: hypothetical protein ENH24_01420 [Nitrospirae bacterium]|nr:hypothetical protein [Nitrospirota bacterium]